MKPTPENLQPEELAEALKTRSKRQAKIYDAVEHQDSPARIAASRENDPAKVQPDILPLPDDEDPKPAAPKPPPTNFIDFDVP